MSARLMLTGCEGSVRHSLVCDSQALGSDRRNFDGLVSIAMQCDNSRFFEGLLCRSNFHIAPKNENIESIYSEVLASVEIESALHQEKRQDRSIHVQKNDLTIWDPHNISLDRRFLVLPRC